MTTTENKNGPEVLEHLEANAHNTPAGDLMNTQNTTVLTVQNATDIHWHDVDKQAVVLVDCREHGCMLNGTPHLLSWGDMLLHKASVLSEGGLLVEVVKFAACDEVPIAESKWYVAGWLEDDDYPLTPQRVATFTDAYYAGVTLADQLNAKAGA